MSTLGVAWWLHGGAWDLPASEGLNFCILLLPKRKPVRKGSCCLHCTNDSQSPGDRDTWLLPVDVGELGAEAGYVADQEDGEDGV